MLTNFPNGVSSYGIPLIGAGPVLTTGKVFFVDSTSTQKADEPSNGGSPDRPFATIAYAVTKCRSGKGDFIIAAPGHVETISAAGSVTIDKAEVTILGLGRGSTRAKIDFTTATAADININAEGIGLYNFYMECNIDALAGGIDVNAPYFTMQGCQYVDGSGVQATSLVLADANADFMRILDHEHYAAVAAGPQTAFSLVGCDRVRIERCVFDGNFATSVIDCLTTAVTNLTVRDIQARNRSSNDLIVKDTITGSTGQIGPNIAIRLADDAANITEAITGATFVVIGPVKVVNAANEQGFDINWTVSADA